MTQLLRILTLSSLTFCIAGWVTAQDLSPEDFRVGSLKLRSPIDSVLRDLPKPDYFDLHGTYDEYLAAFYLKGNYDSLLARLETWETLGKKLRYSDYITARYRKLVIWYNKVSHIVKGFDIQDSTFQTARGISVGDPLNKLTSVYGHGTRLENLSTDELEDQSFHDYAQIRQYSLGDYHMAFFLNGQRITKISVFFSLSLSEDDWSIRSLKLGESFDVVLRHLGKPDTTMPGEFESTGFYFPKVVLWRDNASNTLFALDVYDSSYVTHRGLRVGSPSSDVERLYGDRGDVDGVTLSFVPYDSRFDGYDTSTAFNDGRHYMVVFSRAQRVVKILLSVTKAD